MFTNNFDPVAIYIFSLEIRWYSLAYISGIVIGWILGKKFLISNQDIKEKFDDYVTYLILGVIIGGRIGYVLFYNFKYYSENIIEIFKIWHGGMSFHGGLIGMIFFHFINDISKLQKWYLKTQWLMEKLSYRGSPILF